MDRLWYLVAVLLALLLALLLGTWAFTAAADVATAIGPVVTALSTIGAAIFGISVGRESGKSEGREEGAKMGKKELAAETQSRLSALRANGSDYATAGGPPEGPLADVGRSSVADPLADLRNRLQQIIDS